MVNQYNDPAIGDRVLVPWGLEEVLGEVVDIFATGLGPRVQVRMVGDADGPTVTLPLDSVIRERDIAGGRGPTIDVATARGYEERVGAALDRAIRGLNERHLQLDAQLRTELALDAPADFEVTFGRRRLLVEVKYRAPNRRVTTDTVLTYAGLADTGRGVLLVANTPLATAAAQRLEQLWGHRTYIWFAQWRGPRDDRHLREAFDRFVGIWNSKRSA